MINHFSFNVTFLFSYINNHAQIRYNCNWDYLNKQKLFEKVQKRANLNFGKFEKKRVKNQKILINFACVMEL